MVKEWHVPAVLQLNISQELQNNLEEGVCHHVSIHSLCFSATQSQCPTTELDTSPKIHFQNCLWQLSTTGKKQNVLTSFGNFFFLLHAKWIFFSKSKFVSLSYIFKLSKNHFQEEEFCIYTLYSIEVK